MKSKKSLDRLLRDSLNQPQPLPPVDDFWQDFASRLDGETGGSTAEPANTAPPDAAMPGSAPAVPGGTSAPVITLAVLGAVVAGLALLNWAAISPNEADPSLTTYPSDGRAQPQTSPAVAPQQNDAAPISLYSSPSKLHSALEPNTSTPSPHQASGHNTSNTSARNIQQTAAQLPKNAADLPVKKQALGDPVPEKAKALSAKGVDNQGVETDLDKKALEDQALERIEQTTLPNGLENESAMAEKKDAEPMGAKEEDAATEVVLKQHLDFTALAPRQTDLAWPSFAPAQADYALLSEKQPYRGKARALLFFAFLGTEPLFAQDHDPSIFQLLSVGAGVQRPLQNNWAIRAELSYLQNDGPNVRYSNIQHVDPNGTRLVHEESGMYYRMNRASLGISMVKRRGHFSFIGGATYGRWLDGYNENSYIGKSEIFGTTGSGYSYGTSRLPSHVFNLNYFGLRAGIEANPFGSRWFCGAAFYQQLNDLTKSSRYTVNQDFMLYVGRKF